MRLNSTFLSAEQIIPTPAFKLQPGQIAFLSGYDYPIMRAELADKTPVFVDLGGNDFLNIWNAHDRDETAFALPSWRLEIDPTSLIEGRFASPVAAFAFRTDTSFGIFAYRQGPTIRPHVVSIDVSGISPTFDPQGSRVFFSKWRIVSGSEDAPIVWAQSADVPA